MSFIRATYNLEIVTKVSDSSEIATNYKKWWPTEEGISDTIGVWNDTNNRFIPDGMMCELTGWFWPEDFNFIKKNYDA